MGQQYGIISGGGGVGDVEISVSQVVGGTSGEVLVVGGAGELEQVAIDTTPTNGSTNLIDSNAVFDGLATKVPDSRTITINGTTQDLTVNRTWTIPTGITVGTTAISSGTVGRVLFEGAGNVIQEDAALFWDNTNKRLGIGATPDTSVRLDVRSQGALSTDIAFRVRNSANNHNLFSIQGTNRIDVGETNGLGQFLINGSARTSTDLVFRVLGLGSQQLFSAQQNGVVRMGLNNNNIWFDGTNWNVANSGNTNWNINANKYFLIGQASGIGIMTIGTLTVVTKSTSASEYVTCITNSTGNGYYERLSNTNVKDIFNTIGVPSTNVVDAFRMYASDIVAGNAAPHFRTENGDIVKLYSVGGWGLPTGTLTRTTFDSGTVTLAELAERVAALITDLRDSHGLLKA